MMVRLTPIYPDGLTGVALLLIRVSYAFLTFSSLPLLQLSDDNWWYAALGGGVISVALLIGLGTRWAALLLTLSFIAAAFAAPVDVAVILLPHAGGAGALGILGPGAFSIDAHLFGRRVIRVAPRHSRGNTDS